MRGAPAAPPVTLFFHAEITRGDFCRRFNAKQGQEVSHQASHDGIEYRFIQHNADQAEDILTQVMAAHLLFVDVLGFPDPFQTERFRSARFLDITIRSKSVLKCNGLPYDELQRSKNGDWIGMKVALRATRTALSPKMRW